MCNNYIVSHLDKVLYWKFVNKHLHTWLPFTILTLFDRNMEIILILNLLTIFSASKSAVIKSRSGPPLPEPCLLAQNLTESWRLDHKGNVITPGGPYSEDGAACDFHKDLQWFRFTGAAGEYSSLFNKNFIKLDKHLQFKPLLWHHVVKVSSSLTSSFCWS